MSCRFARCLSLCVGEGVSPGNGGEPWGRPGNEPDTPATLPGGTYSHVTIIYSLPSSFLFSVPSLFFLFPFPFPRSAPASDFGSLRPCPLVVPTPEVSTVSTVTPTHTPLPPTLPVSSFLFSRLPSHTTLHPNTAPPTHLPLSF